MKKLAVVYVSNGNDRNRIWYSLCSLKKFTDLDFDVYILTDNPDNMPKEYPIDLKIISCTALFEKFGFDASKWNRTWPIAILARLLIPLVNELKRYDKIVSMESDILLLRPGFDVLCNYPCRDYEIIGTSFDPYSNNFPDYVHYKSNISEEFQKKLQERIWINNPIETHVHFNPGMCVWNIKKILENGEDWYEERIREFYSRVEKGCFRVIDEDFINMMMDSAALIHPKYHCKPRQPTTEADIVVYHFLSCCRGPGSRMWGQAALDGYPTCPYT